MWSWSGGPLVRLRGDGDDPEAGASSPSTTAIEDGEGHETDGRELIRKGRVGMTLTLMNAPGPFPTELAVAMAGAMVSRA